MNAPLTKLFVTKYALTKGIYEVEAEQCATINPDMYRVPGGFLETYHKGDYEFTAYDANRKTKEMARKKKISLLKAIAKLEKTFGV